jgi:phosphatidylserine synthase
VNLCCFLRFRLTFCFARSKVLVRVVVVVVVVAIVIVSVLWISRIQYPMCRGISWPRFCICF